MNVTSITYDLEGAVLTVTYDSPGTVRARYTDLAGVTTFVEHAIEDLKSAYIAANKILGMHHGMVGMNADAVSSTIAALAVTLEDLAEG